MTQKLPELADWLGDKAVAEIAKWILDKRSGNIRLNISNGQLLSFKIEEYHKK